MPNKPLPPPPMTDRPVELGNYVRDRITGAEGYVIGITTWLFGCRRLVVQPDELTDSRPVDPIHLDEPQAYIISLGISDLVDQREPRPVASPGGPREGEANIRGEANLRRPDPTRERH